MNKQKIFEKYLKYELNDYEFINALDNLQDKDRKADGVVYTPEYIVKKIIELSDPKMNESIIEPSCGHGAFLFELVHYISKKENISGIELKSWFIDKVKGIDISQTTVNELKEMLVCFFDKHYRVESTPEDFINIICGDSLYIPLSECDLAIGNPPYVRARNLEESYLKRIKKDFKYCEKGNIDIYYAFIERYQQLAKRLCFISPNSFLTNISGKNLAYGILEDVSLLIDFKDKIIFTGIRAYTCILELNKEKRSNQMLYSNDLETEFKSVDPSILLTNFRESKKDLTIIAEIATLANSLYTVKKRNDSYYVLHENKEYPIEKAAIRPFLKITKVKNNIVNIEDFIIFPYNKDFKIIPEEDYRNKFPLAYQYLCTIRNKLDIRDKGKVDKYESWYAYGRKQGFYKGQFKKALSIPKIIGESCLPQLVDVTNISNEYNDILITSGFLIPYDESNASDLDKLLTQEFLNYVRTYGKVWPGKTEPYYAVSAKNIKQFLS